MILGIDPGFTGGLAWYDEVSKRLVHAAPMPIFQRSGEIISDTRKQIDAKRLAEMIRPSLPELRVVVMETVSSSPEMGVVSAFRFGEGFGILRGVLAGLGAPYPKNAYPNVWKSALSLTSNKDRSAELAIKLFPEWAPFFLKEKRDAGVAEAALLAYYGTRFISSVAAQK